MFHTREYRQYEIKQREFETHGRLKNEILLVKLFIRLFCNEAFFHQLLHSSSMAINFRNRMNVLANYEVNGLAYNIRHCMCTDLFPNYLVEKSPDYSLNYYYNVVDDQQIKIPVWK